MEIMPITVLMVVYNAEKYLRDAIRSVLNQSFKNFLFLIVDDGSTDNTVSVIRSFQNRRIRMCLHEHDYIASLNFGLEQCESKYVARMDADDLMHPDRLRVQYAVMEEEPSIDICGTWMYGFKDTIRNGVRFAALSGIIEKPLKHLFEKNVFYHPTMMFRTSFFKKHGLKYEEYPYAEDYKLWFEAAKCKAKFYVEPQPLYYYRNNDTQVSVVRKHDQAKTKARIQEEILCHLLSRSSYRNLFYKNYQNQKELVQKGLLSYTTMFSFFRILFNESEPEVYF